MRRSDDTDPPPDDQRRTELALIFAAAILRLRQRIALADSDVPDEAETCLEVTASFKIELNISLCGQSHLFTFGNICCHPGTIVQITFLKLHHF